MRTTVFARPSAPRPHEARVSVARARSRGIGSASLLALALGALGACLGTGGGRCIDDADCSSGACARTGECSPQLSSVRIRWTVAGQPADDESCAAHPWLYLSFADPRLGDELRYQPIRCSLGQIYYDRLPERMDLVTLGKDGGRFGDTYQATIRPPENELDFDLRAQAAPVD
ncbi:hypothetical protein [Haliangium ochraceum]|uniref:Uncharacterized protein n=1 Tax=Haliangium ochraceum (strain DSM 14365 / JCM 11303 / SMP-2) TaxID=502025 RepID=D0LY59_HALO1|nr:hypothetical protein [Haliangium ochraceum]ACY16209.1 hypothetical protein Hoch_3709 [Haliangium ochraceum DSM 14365]